MQGSTSNETDTESLAEDGAQALKRIAQIAEDTQDSALITRVAQIEEEISAALSVAIERHPGH